MGYNIVDMVVSCKTMTIREKKALVRGRAMELKKKLKNAERLGDKLFIQNLIDLNHAIHDRLKVVQSLRLQI